MGADAFGLGGRGGGLATGGRRPAGRGIRSSPDPGRAGGCRAGMDRGTARAVPQWSWPARARGFRSGRAARAAADRARVVRSGGRRPWIWRSCAPRRERWPLRPIRRCFRTPPGGVSGADAASRPSPGARPRAPRPDGPGFGPWAAGEGRHDADTREEHDREDICGRRGYLRGSGMRPGTGRGRRSGHARSGVPTATTRIWPATVDGTRLTYVTREGDLSMPGVHRLQASFSLGAGPGAGPRRNFWCIGHLTSVASLKKYASIF
jgi:hypothetical protein